VQYTLGMNAHPYPTELTDAAWELIKHLLPPPKPGGRHRELDMRAVIDAIVYVVDGGIKWRMLPHEYPKWPSVYWYCSQWRDSGAWQRLHDTLRAQVRQQAGRHKHPTAGCLDSQSVKTTELGGKRGDDKGKNVKGRKRHLVVETLGLLMAVLVTAASVSDPAGARLLVARLGGACKKLRLLWVDGGYRGQLVEGVSQHRRLVLRVTLRPEGTQGFVLLPRRWVVERTLAWLNQSRRLSKDSERLPKSSEAMIYLSMTRLMLRRLAAA
jgi:putative transposase